MTEIIEGRIVDKPRTRNGKAIAGMSPDNPTMSAKQKRVWRLYAIEGWTQQEIAAELGISQPYVSSIVSAVRRLLPQETREAIVQEHIDALRGMRAALEPAAMRGVASAVKAYVKVLEREARMLGLDAPTSLALSDGSQVMHYVLEAEDGTDLRKVLGNDQ